MNRYWDLTERERSELTAEQVESMLAIELMEKGVTKVDEPKLLTVEFPEIPKKVVWTIKQGSYSRSDVAYETADAAAAALKGGFWLKNQWVDGATIYSIERDPLTVEAFEVSEAADVIAVKSQTDKAAANKKANDAALKDYNDACRCAREAVEGVWDDWHDRLRDAAKYKKVIATREEYRSLCDGNERLANTFLAKAYDADTIRAAREWFGEAETAEAAEAPVAFAMSADEF